MTLQSSRFMLRAGTLPGLSSRLSGRAQTVPEGKLPDVLTPISERRPPASTPRYSRLILAVSQADSGQSRGPRQHSGSSKIQVLLRQSTKYLKRAISVLPKLQVSASSHLFTSAALILSVTILLGVYTFGLDQGFATFLLQFEQFRMTAT